MSTETNQSGFDDLKPVDQPDDDGEDVEWLDLAAGDSVVGELREIRENCGEYGSRVYKIQTGIGEPVKLVWGKASIDRQVDAAELGPGSLVGIQNTGEEYETDNGYSGVRYEVRSE